MTQTLPARPHLPAEAEPRRKPEPRRRPVRRAAARGAIASMAMSGSRQFTTALGLVERTPPESVIERTAPRMFHKIPVGRRPALVEAVHWTYGAVGGAVFGLLPGAVRRRKWAGPVYGLLVWAAFETAIAPALGLPRRKGTAVERIALLADHLLYGTVVGASPWPYQDTPQR
ncbi:hypothetical protein ABGB14_33930 [Nonomuraea sp. B10E15]|uniref:hypothetical protein n=1 Tax=Nonomuraea sp. B10E15 TaxID=3153560 RepID=UPI00325D2E0E